MSIFSPTLAEMREHISNPFLLVNVVSYRARQITEDMCDLKEAYEQVPLSKAMEEVCSGVFTEADCAGAR